MKKYETPAIEKIEWKTESVGILTESGGINLPEDDVEE